MMDLNAAGIPSIVFASHDRTLLHVRHFSVRESMNELFEIRVIAVSHDENIDIDTIVGRGAAFALESTFGPRTWERVWAGFCAEMTQIKANTPPQMATYQLLLVPA